MAYVREVITTSAFGSLEAAAAAFKHTRERSKSKAAGANEMIVSGIRKEEGLWMVVVEVFRLYPPWVLRGISEDENDQNMGN